MEKNIFMTYNLKVDFIEDGENSWASRCKKIEKIINDNNPICFSTQEGLSYMIEDLKKGLEIYDYVGEGRLENSTGEYAAIFYKKDTLKLIDSKQFWLSETPNIVASKSWDTACERICTYAVFENKITNKKFIVYNTHLDHESNLARKEGMKLIIKTVKENYIKEKIPYIIMGDFNCNSDDEVFEGIKLLEDDDFKAKNIYELTSHNIEGTFHDFTGILSEGIIDFILVSKEIECKNIKIDERKIGNGYPSDHYPVIATLEF